MEYKDCGGEDMKKALAAFIAILLLALAGCGEESLRGEVIDESDGCLVLTGEDEIFALRLNGTILAFTPDTGTFIGAQLDIPDARRDGSMEYEGENIKVYAADGALISGELESNVMRLAGGTEIDVMRTTLFGDYYRLNDGTELLREAFSVGGSNSVPEEAAQAIEAYLSLHKPYDLSALLEAAYAEYSANPEEFAYHSVSFDVMPSTVSEDVAYYRATVSIANVVVSDNVRTGSYAEYGYAFDRETGEIIDNRELFTLPWDEAREALIAAAQPSDAERAQLMAEKLTPDGVCITDSGISLNYPEGVIDELSLGAHIDFASIPAGLLYAWAAPEAWNTGE